MPLLGRAAMLLSFDVEPVETLVSEAYLARLILTGYDEAAVAGCATTLGGDLRSPPCATYRWSYSLP